MRRVLDWAGVRAMRICGRIGAWCLGRRKHPFALPLAARVRPVMLQTRRTRLFRTRKVHVHDEKLLTTRAKPVICG